MGGDWVRKGKEQEQAGVQGKEMGGRQSDQ